MPIKLVFLQRKARRGFLSLWATNRMKSGRPGTKEMLLDESRSVNLTLKLVFALDEVKRV